MFHVHHREEEGRTRSVPRARLLSIEVMREETGGGGFEGVNDEQNEDKKGQATAGDTA